jgi:hypothetical protein
MALFSSIDDRDIPSVIARGGSLGEGDSLLRAEWDRFHAKRREYREAFRTDADIWRRRLDVVADPITGKIEAGQDIEEVGIAPTGPGMRSTARFAVLRRGAPLTALDFAPDAPPTNLTQRASDMFDASEDYIQRQAGRDEASFALERQTRLRLGDPRAGNVPRVVPRPARGPSARITWNE